LRGEVESVENEKRFLLIDGGDLFAKQKQYQRFYAELYIAALDHMGYDALTIGRRELIEGPEMIGHIAALAEFAVICTNFRSEQVALNPYRLFTRNGIRIAVMGVVAPSPGIDPAFHIDDPEETVRGRLKQIADETDVVVLVSQLPSDWTRDLISAVPGLDVVISLQDKIPNEGETIGKTLLVSPGQKGEHVGVVDLVWDANAKKIKNMVPKIHALDKTVAADRAINDLVREFNTKVDRERAREDRKKAGGIGSVIQKNMQMSPEEFIRQMRQQEKKDNDQP
jgi:2',3'-cyclic-nucleotide 2'-phosphodiesterase (5'-nucleotidase family)